MAPEIKLSEELCEITGAFMGDGCIHKTKDNHYIIQYSGDSRYDIDYYKKRIGPTIENIFGSKLKIKKVKNKNAIRAEIYSKRVFLFFKEFLGLHSTRKTTTIKIPSFLLEPKNERYLNSLIRGLFDTDGGVFLDKRKIYKTPYPRWFFHTTSKELHKQLKKYLSKHFNIYTNRRKYKNPNHQDLYYLEIYGQKQLGKWMERIGFSNPRHLNKIAQVAQSVVARHW
jgi:hypothetical protein